MQLNLFKKKSILKKQQKQDGDLSGKKISNKITKVFRTSPQSTSEVTESETEISKGRSISPQKDSKLLMT